jgi:hypothetical protein
VIDLVNVLRLERLTDYTINTMLVTAVEQIPKEQSTPFLRTDSSAIVPHDRTSSIHRQRVRRRIQWLQVAASMTCPIHGMKTGVLWVQKNWWKEAELHLPHSMTLLLH